MGGAGTFTGIAIFFLPMRLKGWNHGGGEFAEIYAGIGPAQWLWPGNMRKGSLMFQVKKVKKQY